MRTIMHGEIRARLACGAHRSQPKDHGGYCRLILRQGAYRLSASCVQVVTETSHKDQLRHFLDSQQYTTNSILRYERIFGAGFVSTGGLETTQVCLAVACFSDLVQNSVKVTAV